MRRSAAVLAAAALTFGGLTTIAPAALATTCPAYTWGSTPEVDDDYGTAPVSDVRAGRHTCFDRVVFDLAGGAPQGWRVEYVDQVIADGSGKPVSVPGGAKLQVVLNHGVQDPNTGQVVFDRSPGPVANVAGFETLRSVYYVGSFEGQTQFALGTRAKLPFQVSVLNGPGSGSRIVVDVAHRWTAW